MAILLKRQISDDEKETVLKRFGKTCFATGHPIDNDESIQFDHIKAYAQNGASEIDNIAPMCGKHNKQKGQLSLYDFKIKLKIDEFFTSGENLTLKDELDYLKLKKDLDEYGETISIIEQKENSIKIEIQNKNQDFTLYTCPTTDWNYFYATLPIEILDSDDDADNEIGLQPRYLIKKLTKSELNKRFKSFLYNSILDDNNNKLARFVSKGNRSSAETPITMDMLEKSIFSNFLFRYPVEADMTTDKYIREIEFNNLVRLMNIIYEESLTNWDGEQTNSDPEQLKLSRIFRSKSIMSWAEILFDSICATLKLYDSDEKMKLMHRTLSEDSFKEMRFNVRRLINWNIWDSPINSDIDRILADNKNEIKKWFKEKGLTTGYLMGASE